MKFLKLRFNSNIFLINSIPGSPYVAKTNLFFIKLFSKLTLLKGDPT